MQTKVGTVVGCGRGNSGDTSDKKKEEEGEERMQSTMVYSNTCVLLGVCERVFVLSFSLCLSR